ncbi:uncharacterized protein [Tenebrio molitor]|uniref:uncharacterized protein n=1 Tax=Tenebrio molitor TaxID=7067 RepID=UPI00362481D9
MAACLLAKQAKLIARMRKWPQTVAESLDEEDPQEASEIIEKGLEVLANDWEDFRTNHHHLEDDPGNEATTYLENDDLEVATLAYYLKQSLKGTAACIVQNVAVTDANFAPVWKEVCQRYTNGRMLAHAHLVELFDMPTPTKCTPVNMRSILDHTKEEVRALEALGCPTQYWDDLFMTLRRLDDPTRYEWQIDLTNCDKQRKMVDAAYIPALPTFQQLEFFLDHRIRALEMSMAAGKPHHGTPIYKSVPVKARVHAVGATSSSPGGQQVPRLDHRTCPICKEDHKIYSCGTFQGQTSGERYEQVTVCSPNGKQAQTRALLDSGSETTLIAEHVVHQLQLPRTRSSVNICGIGETAAGSARFQTDVRLKSRVHPDAEYTVTAVILPKLTGCLPRQQIAPVDALPVDPNDLADPYYFRKAKIGLVLGADIYGSLLRPGLKRSSCKQVTAQDTTLGWVVSGSVSTPEPSSAYHQCTSPAETTDELHRFWETSSVSVPEQPLTPEDALCEEHFRETYGRNTDGRFVPFSNVTIYLSALPVSTTTPTWMTSCQVQTRFRMRSVVATNSELLAKGKFELGKWTANHRSLLPLGTTEAAASSTQPVLSGQPAKMLGVMWSLASDEFLFEFTPPDSGGRPITKRIVLSWISRIFDPLGWIGPIVVRAKIFLQDLWLSHTGWDEPLSRPMLRCWREFVNALETLPVLRIPRWTSLSTDTKGVELHVFCDASTRAYAAALYVRFPISNNRFKITLLTSKSKVSPLQTMTVPRLEFCAAQLGVRLLRHVLKENSFSKCPITAWSDSQIALAWIHGHPSRWKTFVANRVSYIQTSLPALTWRYIPSSDNPADRRCYSDEPGSVSRRSSLLRLYPVLDPAGTMLVGGRLSYSHVPFSERHPPILPKTSPLAELFIRNAHAAMLHASATLTTSYLMRQVWIPGAQSMVKRFIRSCVPCFRFRPRHGGQLMGQLPPSRVTPARPFSRTGLDYAGPIMCRTTAGRGHKSYKAYSSFVSRRDLCAELYSDNGTTFVGADAELRRLFQSASDLYKEVAPTLAQDGITWSFIPPYAPHFGGLWEAGVKSVKSLLLKAIGPRTLTFEEMTTYLAQVEACLNSRPLTPLSSDASDITALTPAHFLVGSTLGLVPEPPIEEDPSKLLVRWRQVQQAQQCFWRRWSLQYLNHLQQRDSCVLLEATSASFPTLDRSFGIIGDITSRAVTGVANTARLTGVPLSDHSVTIIFSISTLGVGVTLGVGHQLIL